MSRTSGSFSLGDLPRIRTKSARSAASASAWMRISGTTAPSMMAVRTDCERVLGPDHDRRGRRRPTAGVRPAPRRWWLAARGIARTPRSFSSSGLRRASVSTIRSSPRATARPSISAWLNLRRSSPIAVDFLPEPSRLGPSRCSERIVSSSWLRWRSASCGDCG